VIILDTNILSALMRSTPDAVVVEWLDNQPTESVWTTAVTVFEIWTGITLLDNSQRREGLTASFQTVLTDFLDGRVLPFDEAAAHYGGVLAAQRQRAGKVAEIRDVQIAAIALARRGTVATRNARHFRWPTVKVVNPWDGVREKG
jgi:predicted nucleic acid-binding protein